MVPAVETALDTLRAAGDGLLVVVTGAGVSHASGIATFRGSDPDAVWSRDVTELGTRAFFEREPVTSWQWYLKRFSSLEGKQPNAGHAALVDIEQWQASRGGSFCLVTQNIDTLHEQAGSSALVKVHGSADRVRCSRDGCEHAAPRGSLARASFDITPFLVQPSNATLPRCPACEAVLRQHVLWFDETYDEHVDYQWTRVLDAAMTMQAVLFVGTSFSVGVTDLFAQAAVSRGIPAAAVDPGARASPHPRIALLAEPSETLLPAVAEGLAD